MRSLTKYLAFTTVGLVVGLGAATVFPLITHAGPISDQAADIEGLLDSGDDLGALTAARELLGHVWDTTAGLSFGETLLTPEPAAGYGIYNPRPDNKFKLGTPVLIYAEPAGFGYGSPGDGLFAIGFFVDLKVLNEAGDLIGDLQNVTELNLVSRYPNREFQANLTYSLDGIPAGVYRLQTTLRDKNSAKTGSFETVVEFVE